MVSLSYSAPTPSSNDPVFVRTNFLGRVASDGLGLEYQHELLKRRSSRHSDLHRWDANWLAPVTQFMTYESDETSDTDDDVFESQSSSREDKHTPAHHLRARSSTLPVLYASNAPVEMARARSMTGPVTSSSSTSSFTELRASRKNRASADSGSRLLPERPLTIDTAQPLRLSTSSIPPVPSPMATVQPSPKTCSAPVVRIECSESDGSCHGDAGDQDPEAQLAAGIIRLREQRRSTAKTQLRRTGTKRRSTNQLSRSPRQQSLEVVDDMDSDDADSLLIRKHGGSFVLRLAEMVLDFGSSALEKLVAADGRELSEESMAASPSSPLQPRRRSSTTPQELTAEAGELLRRRRERRGTVLPSDSVSEMSGVGKAVLTRSWSVPKLLSLPLFNPSASLRALSSSTASTPVTPMSTPPQLFSNTGLTTMAHEPAHEEVASFDEVGASFVRKSISLYSKSSNLEQAYTGPEQVSPLWKQ